jgi:hypothetical protein
MYDDIFTYSGTVTLTGNFKNILAFISSNCGHLRSRAEQVNYNEADVLGFTKEINDCVSPSSVNEVLYKKAKTETHVYAYAGGMYIGTKNEFAARLMAKFTFPTLDKRIAFNVGINFMNLNENKDFYYTDLGIISPYDKKTSSVTTQMVSVPLTIQFYFVNGKLKPYFEGGVCYLIARISGDLGYDLYPLDTRTVNGFNPVGAIGIDFNVGGNLAIKAELRYDYVWHLPTIGIMYTF